MYKAVAFLPVLTLLQGGIINNLFVFNHLCGFEPHVVHQSPKPRFSLLVDCPVYLLGTLLAYDSSPRFTIDGLPQLEGPRETNHAALEYSR